MTWLELTIDVDPSIADAVSEAFARVGYGGGVVVEQSLLPRQGEPPRWEELAEAAVDPSRPVSVRTYLPEDTEAEGRIAALKDELRSLGSDLDQALKVRQCKEEDWANAWKAYYEVQRVGQRTVIKPSWLDYTPAQGDVVVDLDPGMAFGTGLHATTRLCLEALEEYVKEGQNILDLGTGSGILAISAAKLGGPGAIVIALDTDPVAVEAARRNVERNGLSGQIRVNQGSVSAAEESAPYDLVVANILASIIIELSRSLHDLLAPGGTLISSGIFVDRGAAAVEALEKVGLPVREKRQEGDWLCLVSVREP